MESSENRKKWKPQKNPEELSLKGTWMDEEKTFKATETTSEREENEGRVDFQKSEIQVISKRRVWLRTLHDAEVESDEVCIH